MKYQVVYMDKKGFIEGFDDYDITEINKMLEDIRKKITSSLINKTEIIRWDKGKRV